MPENDTEPLMRFFDAEHLPEHLAEVSQIFIDAAEDLIACVPRSPERTIALRKLLEGKDAGVRAALD